MEERKKNYITYPEGFKMLAADLKLPVEGTEARETFLWNVIVALTKA